MLIAARALQGAAGAIFPLAFGIVRDEFPPERVGVALGFLSATFGVGAGLGLVLSGVILEGLSWHWLFWIGAVPIVVALVLVWRFVPESPVRTPSKFDGWGDLSLSVGLGAVLLALSEGESWGWLSAATLGCFAAGLAILVLWCWIETRVADPMMDMRIMRQRTVLWTNVLAVVVGFSMYGTYLLIPTLVQLGQGLPPELAAQVPFGFSGSVVMAGLYLLPATITMLLVGPVGGMLEPRVGARSLTFVGLLAIGVAAFILATAHAQPWQLILAVAVLGVGVGLVYAMLAKLIVDAVAPSVTGVAMGMNTVMRTVGGTIGGQLSAAFLTSFTVAGTGLPADQAFTLTFPAVRHRGHRRPAGRPAHPAGRAREGGGPAGDGGGPRPGREGPVMRLRWYGQSAFLLSGEQRVFVDPFGPMEGLAARGVTWEYPEIRDVEADLLLVTHEHGDHNGVEAVAGSPAVIRSRAGTFDSPVGEVLGIASEHDDRAGAARGANVMYRLTLDGVGIAHLGDLGQPALRPEQRELLAGVDVLFLPVGGGPTIGGAAAARVVRDIAPSLVVPMHHRTPAIGFLEPPDAFLEALRAEVHRVDATEADVSDHLGSPGAPVVLMLEAPVR